MGRSSQESREIEIDGKTITYHIVRVDKGTPLPDGWYGTRGRLQDWTTKSVQDVLTAHNWYTPKPLKPRTFNRRQYALYLGPAPNPKWGPVCP